MNWPGPGAAQPRASTTRCVGYARHFSSVSGAGSPGRVWHDRRRPAARLLRGTDRSLLRRRDQRGRLGGSRRTCCKTNMLVTPSSRRFTCTPSCTSRCARRATDAALQRMLASPGKAEGLANRAPRSQRLSKPPPGHDQPGRESGIHGSPAAIAAIRLRPPMKR